MPAILGFAAVLKNLSGVADATAACPRRSCGVVVAQLLLSMFLAGGILDRLARDRAIGAGAFFAACGVFFFRFLRLGIIAAARLLRACSSPSTSALFGNVYSRADRRRDGRAHGVLLSRSASTSSSARWCCSSNLVFDYAKIRAVVEDRRSTIGALAAGWRFVSAIRVRRLALYALNSAAVPGRAGLYYLVAPGGERRQLLAFAVGQLYIVLRVIVRLLFAASQTALFQGRLAHAGYVARPVPKWPDSPAAEAIGPQ